MRNVLLEKARINLEGGGIHLFIRIAFLKFVVAQLSCEKSWKL